MKKIGFGTLRFVELFSENEDESIHSYDSYIEAFKLKERLGKDYKVMGSINGMDPVIEVKREDREPIVAFDSRENQLILLANSRKEFFKILERIEDVWKDYSSEMFLPRSPANIAAYKQFVKDIKQIGGIDFEYWIDYAFKELDIRYEV